MFNKLSGRGLLIAALLCFLAGMAVVIQEDHNEPRADVITLGFADSTPTPTPIPVAVAALNLPGGASPSSALLMVQGMVERRLVIWPLDGHSEPQEIDRYVNLFPILLDPTHQRVLYSTYNAVMVLDLAAGRATMIGELDDKGQIALAQWSPDGSAVAYVVGSVDSNDAYYATADGMHEAELIATIRNGLPLDVAWLPDGRPVTISMGLGSLGGLEPHYRVYDPSVQSYNNLPDDIEIIQPWTPWRSPYGAYQIYATSYWNQYRRERSCRTGSLSVTNQKWVYVAVLGGDDMEKHATFEIHNVMLGRSTWLHDGRIVMQGIAEEACAPHASGLYVAELGQQPVQIVQTDPVYLRDGDNEILWGMPYSMSPDETLIAWAQNDSAAQQAVIRLTPVNGGESQSLFQTAPVTNTEPFVFEDQDMILSFTWLP
jgi:hypothetical protein